MHDSGKVDIDVNLRHQSLKHINNIIVNVFYQMQHQIINVVALRLFVAKNGL